jgi:hypothetical protein
MGFQILSQWHQRATPVQPMSDADRHQLFATFAVSQAQTEMPWLMPLLDQLGATIYVGPGLFVFQTPDQPSQWHEVTQLSARIGMVPWAEPSELPQ